MQWRTALIKLSQVSFNFLPNEGNVFCNCIMVIHYFRTVERISAAGHGWERRVGNYKSRKPTWLSQYSHKTEGESKWWAGFSLQTSGRALKPVGYQQTQWSCVCPLLGLDLPQRGWSSPSYRGSPGQPALSAHFAEHNGALCTDALSWWYNPFTARPLLHSWFSCGSRMAIVAGRCRTPWLATASAWYEPHRENVEWSEKDNAVNLACPPSQK